MTLEEIELYNLIKQNPNHVLFSFLFDQNILGEITPISGKTIKIMSDGIPMIIDSFPLNTLNSGINNVDPFAAIRTNKTFNEISNEIASQSPFGNKSIFYKKEREILKGQIPKI